jgi:hypothetical protein
VEHDVPDGGEARRGVVVPEVLRELLVTDKVHGGGAGAEDGRARALHDIGQPLTAFHPPFREHLEVVDVSLDLTFDDPELLDHVGILLIKVLDLSVDRLLDMLLEGEHIGEIAIDGFGGVSRHEYSLRYEGHRFAPI